MLYYNKYLFKVGSCSDCYPTGDGSLADASSQIFLRSQETRLNQEPCLSHVLKPRLHQTLKPQRSYIPWFEATKLIKIRL